MNSSRTLHFLPLLIALVVGLSTLLCPTTGVSADDLYSISPGTISEPDIVWSQRIPVVDEKITISARVRGPGEHPVDVRFMIEGADGAKVARWAQPVQTAQDNTSQYVDYEADWKPQQTGFYTVTVEVDPRGNSADSVTDNNTATVTIPVTWRELHILAWGPQKDCRWVGTANPAWDADDIAYWHRRGTKALGFMSPLQGNLMKLSEEEMIENLVNGAAQHVEAGRDGLILDETGSYPNDEGFEYIRRFGKAFKIIREKYPDLRVYNWIGGEIQREEWEVARANRHVLMPEVYPDLFDRVFDSHYFEPYLQRRLPNLSIDHITAIPALGLGGDCGRRFWPQIESNVRLGRTIAPGLPGICYYACTYLGEGESYEGSFQQFLDRLTLTYFIKPVIMIKEEDIWLDSYSPQRSDPVAVQVRVHNIGGMAATDVGVKIYARHLGTNQRTLLQDTVIPAIGNGTLTIPRGDDAASRDHRVIDGTKHPIVGYTSDTDCAFLDRALLDATWTPQRSGYYAIEVEVQPSTDHTVLEGFAKKTIVVGE